MHNKSVQILDVPKADVPEDWESTSHLFTAEDCLTVSACFYCSLGASS